MAPAPDTLLPPPARETPDDLTIRVINLDRDADRLDWMRGQLDQLGLTFRRFPALTPATLPEGTGARFHPEAIRTLSAGEIGCFASHLRLAEELLSSGDPCWLNLKDDVEIAASPGKCLSFGAADAARLEIAFPAMRARRIKRDTTMRHVPPARRSARS